MHVILGAGGIIANELTGLLLAGGEKVRLVSRRARPQAGAEVMAADLTDAVQTRAAVAGAGTVYLVAGLPYRAMVWEEQWPRIMQHAIEACQAVGARLVFFDNVYAYGRVAGPMTETTPFNPCSRKGEVRARIATALLDEIKAGNLTALIARAPDFYGPRCRTSFVNLFVLDKLAAGSKALWPGRDNLPHSLIFTRDAARGVLRLTAEASAWNQTWHLPTAAPALAGREYVALAAEALGVPPRSGTLGRMMFRAAGLFNGDARESVEMFYQFEEPYLFDSSRIAQALGCAATPYAEGMQQAVAAR